MKGPRNWVGKHCHQTNLCLNLCHLANVVCVTGLSGRSLFGCLWKKEVRLSFIFIKHHGHHLTQEDNVGIPAQIWPGTVKYAQLHQEGAHYICVNFCPLVDVKVG